MPPTLSTGFVPSLEAMPLLAHAMGRTEWRMQPCPSYGRIIRHLLTGELTAGLLPWELGITELVTKPSQQGVWLVPLVLHPCPTELVLSAKAMKLVYPPKGRGRGDAKKLVFGIEGRCSLTRYQILTWQIRAAGRHFDPPAFKVLPMELMRKGLEAGTLDGMVAPTPWGMQAESEGSGRLDPKFEPGKYEQKLVLFCRQECGTAHADLLAALPGQLEAIHTQLTSEAEFSRVAHAMAAMGSPRCDVQQLRKASALHLAYVKQHDFQPDAAWLKRELELLAERVPLGEGAYDPADLSKRLSPQ